MAAEMWVVAVLLGAGLMLVVAGRAAEQRRIERSRLAYRIEFPRELSDEAVRVFLRGVGGLLLPWWRRPFGLVSVVFETWATERGISHWLLIPEQYAGFVTAQLRAAIPSARIMAETPSRPRPALAGELRLVGVRQLLRVDPAAGAAAAILGSLQPLAIGEAICHQWVVAPALGHCRDEHGVLAHIIGRRPASAPNDPVSRRAEREKQGEPLFLAAGRLGVVADTRPRQRHLLRRPTGALHVVRTPSSHLARRLIPSAVAARRLERAATPLLVYPCVLNAAELAVLAAIPMGSPQIAGLRLGGARQLPPPADVPSRGRVIGPSTFPGTDRPIAVSPAESLRHLHIVGPTGVGKSTLLLNMIMQDIASGASVVVIDPKADLVRDVLDRVPRERTRDVVVLDPTDPAPLGLNPPLGAAASPELVTEQIVDIFRRIWRDFWGPRSDAILRHAVYALATTPGMTLAELPTLLTDPTFRRRIVARLDDPFHEAFWGAFEAMSPAERGQAIGPVSNKIGAFVDRRSLRTVLGQATPALRLPNVLRDGGILLVPLAAGRLGEDVSSLCGSLVVMQLWQAVQARAGSDDRPAVFLHVDEFQRFVGTATPFADLLAEARGYGLSLNLAHQSLSQLPTALREAVLANCRTRIVFQLSATDARILARELRPHLEAHDLQGLGAHEVVASVSVGGRTAPPATAVTLPPPAKLGFGEAIREASRERYGRSPDSVDAELKARRERGKAPGPVGRRRRS